jgi:hypothetical protein
MVRQPKGRVGQDCYSLAAALVGAALAASVGAQVPADTNTSLPPIDQELHETAQGHGSVAIGYQTTLTNGALDDRGENDHGGVVHGRRVDLILEYYVADRWSISAGIPFISKRYSGSSPLCPTAIPLACQNQPQLSPPHPESRFLDDGDVHSTWQDWNLGTAYHTDFDNYYVTPSITAYIPSHDYTFFSWAAVGRRQRQLELAISVAHQFDFSNIYYRVGYGYIFVEKTLGINVNNNRFDLELGYFVSPQLTVHVSSLGKFGGGLQTSELFPLVDGATNAYWYNHLKIAADEYASIGAGIDYHFMEKYTLSSSLQKMIWGRTAYEFKYIFDLKLTREF